ncbi:aspartate-semialdehyde dehydrogenase [Klebsiella pneumoniae]|uniref:Aspartate-semialdehyde dehydrogenase n=1 Tax=Klebsiella pneumoniae TaxID=573 RepID=A0A378FQW2_KLEPN|nr:aspartate-semialdehyde dehydrogenase [Klebsiella pneumoniae]
MLVLSAGAEWSALFSCNAWLKSAISTPFARCSSLPPSWGQTAPSFGGSTGGTLQDAFDLDALKALDIIVTCQGGDYTNEIYPKLRASGWQGYWIDAASSLRMKDDAIIILDPVNQDVINAGLNNGVKTFVGGNCTVSLMLMSSAACFAQIWWSGSAWRRTRRLPAAARVICASC